jgi:endogenous inhibitor of DNA gyrase (YacG/DUF329 family)
MKKSPVVACPQCSKEVVWSSDSLFRPFCSERCKLIDLGQWANEDYCIPVNEEAPAQFGELSGQA